MPLPLTFNLTKTDNSPDDFSIVQGSVFDWFSIQIPKTDLTGWIPHGQIRKKFAYQIEEVLAEFLFLPTIYSVVPVNQSGETQEQRSIIRPYLSATQTLSLPPTKNRRSRSVPAKPGSNVWVYDIKVSPPSRNTTVMVARGFVEVIPDVTRDTLPAV